MENHIKTKYPDGSSYVTWRTLSNVDGITFRVTTYEDLWHLNQLLDVLKHQGREGSDITIPCLLDAQEDRRFAPNQSYGLKLVCEMLNKYDNRFYIFHPHNPTAVEAWMNNVKVLDNTSYVHKVLNLSLKVDPNNTILMSADAGGFKPLMKLCADIGWYGETYSASKYREPHTGKLTQFMDRQDFGGKDVVIDDICIYGGTFKGLAKILRERNCGKIYLVVSHMTIQNLGEDPVTDYFDKVFTTNSKYDNYFAPIKGETGGKQPYNLEIIKLF